MWMCLMAQLTLNIHHNEITPLTFEPFDTWKSTQTLQTHKSNNQSISQ